MRPEDAPSPPNAIASAILRLSKGFQSSEEITATQLPAYAQPESREAAAPPYESLFEQVNWNRLPPTKELHEVTTEGVAYRVLEAVSVPYYVTTRILETARFVTSIVDYKTAYPDNPALPGLIHKATEMALAVYRQSPDDIQRIEELLKAIAKIEPRILRTPVQQDLSDVETWKSMNPEYSRRTVDHLIRECGGGPILLIPLARGGFAAGVDVFLRYASQTKNDGSTVYPVRFSRHKAYDERPQLTPAERDYLKSWAKGRHVVIFDDDTNVSSPTKTTLQRARAYFSALFGDDQPLLAIANKELG
jgi:hypothetical protein